MNKLHQNLRKACILTLPITTTLILVGQSSLRELPQTVRSIIGAHSGRPPVVEFEKETSTAKTATRLQKDDRFKYPREPITDPGLSVNGATEDVRPWVVDTVGAAESLPVARSTSIVVGTVTSAEAHIGYDRTSVYSEFHISVQSVLKQDPNVFLSPSTAIIGTREGGTVTFASGHTSHYLRLHHGFPELGKQYLFFLWRDPRTATPDYGIATAYLIANNKLYPIDGGKPFSDYEAADATSTLKSVTGQGGQP